MRALSKFQIQVLILSRTKSLTSRDAFDSIFRVMSTVPIPKSAIVVYELLNMIKHFNLTKYRSSIIFGLLSVWYLTANGSEAGNMRSTSGPMFKYETITGFFAQDEDDTSENFEYVGSIELFHCQAILIYERKTTTLVSSGVHMTPMALVLRS